MFDVYLGEGSLIFAKDPCARADTEAAFFLHLDPVEVADLPYDRKRNGFDNLDFYFDRHGDRFDDKCLATVPIPEYGIARIRTGQFLVDEDDSTTRLWEGEIHFDK